MSKDNSFNLYPKGRSFACALEKENAPKQKLYRDNLCQKRIKLKFWLEHVLNKVLS